MDGSIEVKDLISQVNKGLTALQSEMETVKGAAAKTGEHEQKLNKITESITQAGEQLQVINQKLAAQEAAMNRMDTRGEAGGADKKLLDESKAAFREYARKGKEALEDTDFKHGPEGIEIRSMATNLNPDGGYLVRPEIADFMVTREFETSPMRMLARVITIGSKSIEIAIDDDELVVNNAVKEGAATSSDTDTPDLGVLTITAHAYDAEPRVTTEMLEDSYIDVESWLAEKIAARIGRKENTDFVLGNGVSKARGILTYGNYTSAGVYERQKVEQIALGGASAFTADGFIDLQASLKESYQANATWLMKRSSYGQVIKLKGQDNYFFSTALLKDGQQQLVLLGKPVVFADDMPAMAANALAVAYGDFRQFYTIVDRAGLFILRDPYTVKGKVKFYTKKRTGGDVTNYEAVKIGKVST